MIDKPLVARLRALSEPVPLPLRLPDAAEVANAELRLQLKLHPDFRQYLLELSDVVFGALEPVTITDSGSHTYLDHVCARAWDDCEVPRKLIPICEDNGDFYCMNRRGEIVFRSSDGASDERWNSLAAWIEEVWIGEES